MASVNELQDLNRRIAGRQGPEARRARLFAAKLGAARGVSVELMDEWLGTREATARLRERGIKAKEEREPVDSEAAAVLLQSWLDARQSRS